MRASRIRLGGEFGDLALGYTDWGDPQAARTVVCVHGLTRNARDFDALAAALAARGVRVVAVDVAGRGTSSWLDEPQGYTVPNYARHLRAFLAALGLAQVDWVGTSMGGLIGMTVAAEEDSPIRTLVLNDIGPSVPKEALGYIKTYLGLDLRFETLAELEAHLRAVHAGFGPLSDAQWHHLAVHSARETPEGWRLHYDPQIRVPFAEAAGEDIDLWAEWDRIRCPTHVLRGAESPLLTPATAEAMAGRGPRATVETVPGVGHAPALMAEDQIATVARWLGLK